MSRTPVDFFPNPRRGHLERLAKAMGYIQEPRDAYMPRIFVSAATGDRVELRFNKSGRGGTWAFWAAMAGPRLRIVTERPI